MTTHLLPALISRYSRVPAGSADEAGTQLLADHGQAGDHCATMQASLSQLAADYTQKITGRWTSTVLCLHDEPYLAYLQLNLAAQMDVSGSGFDLSLIFVKSFRIRARELTR